MKLNPKLGLVATAAAGLLAMQSCSDDHNPAASGSGRIYPLVEVNPDAVVARSAQSPSRAGVTVDDLKLRLVSADGSVDRQWESVSAFNVNEEFKVGDYTLTAFYGTVDDEGFEKPCYEGSAKFTVEENETTSVSLTATLANSMVIVRTTEALRDYLTDWSFQIHADGGDYIDYSKTETRAAYVRPGNVTIAANITKPNGQSGSLVAASFTAEARHCYTVNVDIVGGAGSAGLVISFDESLDKEDVVIDISDDILAAPAPEVTTSGFNPATTYEIIEGNLPPISPALYIKAGAGIKSVVMTTQSKSLEEQGWPTEIDLTAASASQQSKLSALGLSVRGLYGNVGSVAQIDLTNVIPNIAYRPAGNNDSQITFVCIDKFGRQSDPVSLSLRALQVELSISSVGELEYGASTLAMTVAYNASNFAENVRIQYKNDRGTWSDTSIRSVNDNGDGTYSVSVGGLPTSGDVQIRAAYGAAATVVSATVDVARAAGIVLEVADNDIYATFAYVDVEGTVSDTPEFAISTDGTNYTAATATPISRSIQGTYKVAGLTPGVKNYVRATVNGKSTYTEITTESAAQLPNSNMETWAITDSAGKWSLYYPGTSADDSVWGTNNPMTTSQGVNYAYCRNSGTIPTSDAHGDSYAALIRTVGWGSGNTAISSDGSYGVTKYIDAGLLHLGSSRAERPSGYSDRTGTISTSDLSCGLSFASRPLGISFWYKYSPKNSSDKGVAEIYVYDASGNVLTQATTTLGSADSYTQKTLQLSYPIGCVKAAKVYVKFLSTDSESFLTKTSDNLSGPGFGSSSGQYLGSQLYIDDITLTY